MALHKCFQRIDRDVEEDQQTVKHPMLSTGEDEISDSEENSDQDLSTTTTWAPPQAPTQRLVSTKQQLSSKKMAEE